MNTAMDDGRQESLGEQTLSFRPVRDDDTFDAFAAGPAKGARRDDSRGPAEQAGGEDPRGPEGQTGREDPRGSERRPGREDPGPPGEPSQGEAAAADRSGSESVNFFAPRRPVAGTDRPAPGTPNASTGRSGPEPSAASGPHPTPEKPAPADPSGGPSLFVRRDAHGGPATTDEAVPEQEEPAAQDEPAIHDEAATAPAAEQPESGRLSAEEADGEQSGDEEASHDEPDEHRSSDEHPSDEHPSDDDSSDEHPSNEASSDEESSEDRPLATEEPPAAAEPSASDEPVEEQPVEDEPIQDERTEHEPSVEESSEERPSPADELSDDGLESDEALADERPQAAEDDRQHDAETDDDPHGESHEGLSDEAWDEVLSAARDEISVDASDDALVEAQDDASDEAADDAWGESSRDALIETPDEASGETPEDAISADSPDELQAAEDTSREAERTPEEAGGTGTEGPGAEKAGGTRTEALPAEAAEALTAALDALRESVADLRFGLDVPGAEEARQAQADLLAQLEDYVLPRVKTSAAPALIVVAGSTGAGKSTLVNSLAERNVSRTGVRRPTTGTPVLVCHPEDRGWFAEGELLGKLERLDKPSRDAETNGIVIVATEKLPQGVALLDTPDIDSVVEEHHEVAHRMLDAADLWIFVTTAARYADAPAWNLLKLAKERGARLAIVLSRVQPRSADVVLKHFVRMLTEYGLGEIDRFVIHEAKVNDGRLPDSEVTDLRLWLAELSVDEERRAQAVRETFNGVLNSFRTRVPALAKHLEAQVAFRTELRSDVEAAFLRALSAIDKASKNGSMLHGEVLARWQDFAGSGDLMRSLQLRRRGRAARQAPERVLAFKAAIRTGLEAVIVAAANRAAEEVVARWRHRAQLGAKLGEGLDRPSDNLVRHTSRAIASWQEHLGELVSKEGVAKRSVSKLVSFDPDSLSLIFMVAMFSGSNGEGVPHRLVNALLGAESLRGIGAKALSDLRARIGMLFDEEAMRYVQALDSAGIPDESVATRLYQATYNLEVAR